MKVIRRVEEVETLDNNDLSKFIMKSCPWLSELWDPTEIGYIFIVDDCVNVNQMTSLCIVPHISEDEDKSYRQLMTIDLATFDLWESAVFDPISRYWQVVAILGQEFGCSIFISDGFVHSLPKVLQNLEKIQQED